MAPTLQIPKADENARLIVFVLDEKGGLRRMEQEILGFVVGGVIYSFSWVFAVRVYKNPEGYKDYVHGFFLDEDSKEQGTKILAIVMMILLGAFPLMLFFFP